MFDSLRMHWALLLALLFVGGCTDHLQMARVHTLLKEFEAIQRRHCK